MAQEPMGLGNASAGGSGFSSFIAALHRGRACMQIDLCDQHTMALLFGQDTALEDRLQPLE